VACAPDAPKALEKCGSTALADNVQSKCYELGRAEFRGVLWPTSKGGSFSLSVVTSNREYEFAVAAPVFDWGVDVKEARPVSSVPDKADSGFEIYSISTAVGTQFTVRLPKTRTPYIYQVHHERAAEALTFMNPAEAISQHGIFGCHSPPSWSHRSSG
jgi:hypothetical protein